jgi:threonine dehydrogenase-like Zn-dependent dehydrogenase
LKKVYDVMMKTNPVGTFREVRAKFSDYAVLGYSGAGIVVEKHPSVTDLAIGQRVAYGGEGTGHGETINIGRNLAARIPDAVPFQHACFTTLGAIAMNAVRQADIQVGDSVAVIGSGLGRAARRAARPLSGRNRDRHRFAKIASNWRGKRRGFRRLRRRKRGREVQALTEGRGADVVIVAAASKSPRRCKRRLKCAVTAGVL